MNNITSRKLGRLLELIIELDFDLQQIGLNTAKAHSFAIDENWAETIKHVSDANARVAAAVVNITAVKDRVQVMERDVLHHELRPRMLEILRRKK